VVNDKNQCAPVIVNLPDANADSVIIPRQGLGTVSMKPQLSDGWNLTALDSATDSKIPETITAISSLGGMATKAAGFGAGVGTTGKAPPGYNPGLYKLNLSGVGEPIQPVFVVTGLVCSTLAVPSQSQPAKPAPPAADGSGK
jgi:hypothetical protein